MKSKKPFLIVCAAALTLALALPFMGVFAFASSSEVSLPVGNTLATSVTLAVYAPGGSSPVASRTIAGEVISSSWLLSLEPGVVYSVVCSSGGAKLYFADLDGNNISSSYHSSNDPFVLGSADLRLFATTSNWFNTLYITILAPPDPLAPVSDGMDTIISVFGDVIDYIINTPDVAIFVAISVAGCAIIPMGIILIKKLIKGY